MLAAFVSLGAEPLRSGLFPGEQLDARLAASLDPDSARVALGALPRAARRRHGRQFSDASEASDASAVATSRRWRLRVHIDASALYEPSTVPPGGLAVCFHTNQAYTRGLGALTGGEACAGTAAHCVGTCAERDVLTEARRSRFVGMVREVLDRFDFLSLPADGGDGGSGETTAPASLVLPHSAGRHDAYFRSLGVPSASSCARDCALLNNWHADPSFCTTGVPNADVVLALVATPEIEGVQASGGACAFDPSTGHATVWILNWHQPLASAGTVADLAQQWGGVIRHELIHAAGFVWSQLYASHQLESAAFTDLDDGAREVVWAFRADTAVAAVGRAHFNCSSARVSLMGPTNELGAHNHFDTRTLRGEVMSYSRSKAVSAFTLAALHDLGWWHVHSERAECVRWGQNQGCGFLESRCGAVRHDRSVRVPDRDACRGDPAWPANWEPTLAAKCARGVDPCSDDAVFDAATRQCDTQCAHPHQSGDGGTNGTTAPGTCAPADFAPHADRTHTSIALLPYALVLFVSIGALSAVALSSSVVDYS